MKIDEQTGIVTINRTEYHLTKNEIKTLKGLLKKKMVTPADIYEEIYRVRPVKMSDYDKRLVYISIGRLKRKIPGLIVNRYYGFGYELGGIE